MRVSSVYNFAFKSCVTDSCHRPKEIETGPWSSISSDERDVEAMTEAARHPQLVTVSDWSQYTSDEYWNASLQSELLIL